EVQRLARRLFEEVPVRVQRVSQVEPFDGAPDRVAIEVDQDRGRRRPEHLRRVRLDARRLARFQLALVNGGQHAVEIEDPFVDGPRLHVRNQRLDLVGRQRLEVVFGDAQVEADDPLVQGYHGRTFDLDGAERGLLCASRL